ncbi:MAG: hypothetical protein V3574_01265 [Candidatus Moraniibacteriota bacterium]
MKKTSRKVKIYVPWQSRFIAGLFNQLNLFSDRDIALYLQKESSFPKDGSAEKIFRSFAKGLEGFPKAWEKILREECEQQFIRRWERNLQQNQPEIQTSQNKDIEKIPSKLRLISNKQETVPEKKEFKSDPLPNSILSILKISLLESLEGEKLNPEKLVRALKRRSVYYKIKRNGRTVFFSGKRKTHRFDIPSEIELVLR